MERTKGKLKVTDCASCKADRLDIWCESENRKDCGTIVCGEFELSFNRKTANANAKHLVKCWNAFEPDGLVDKLVGALEYAENKTYILKNSKGAISSRFKRDLLKMDTKIKEALALALAKETLKPSS